MEEWIAAGVTIDGIGSQSHSGAGGSSGTADALALLADSASEVAITELDIAEAAPSDYEAVTQACLDLEKCVGITVSARGRESGVCSSLQKARFEVGSREELIGQIG